jgi:hypothetical protein
VTILQIGGGFKSIAILFIQTIFSIFGVFVLWEIYGIIRARGKDVSYWHKRLVGAEQGLPSDEREFMKFKIHQKLRRDDSSYFQRILDAESKVEEEQVNELVGKGLGHTRRVIDRWLSFGIFSLWILLISVSAIFVIFPGLQ